MVFSMSKSLFQEQILQSSTSLADAMEEYQAALLQMAATKTTDDRKNLLQGGRAVLEDAKNLLDVVKEGGSENNQSLAFDKVAESVRIDIEKPQSNDLHIVCCQSSA